MLSHLDRVLYPTRCEVIEIVPSQRYVFPIFKNGRSSWYQWRDNNDARILINQQITRLECVDVILRDPDQRLISGINTYIQFQCRDHPELDPHTVEWYAINLFWLNNHYATQLSWLLSLSRYLHHDAMICFRPMCYIDHMTQIHISLKDVTPPKNDLIDKIKQANHWEMYQRLDQCLLDLVGQNITWTQTLEFLKQKDPWAWDYVVGYTKSVMNPLYVLS